VSRPTVLLVGDFGSGDPGHEAVLTSFLRALPGYALVATSSDPRATTIEHGCVAVDRTDRAAVARVAAGTDALVVAGGTLFAAGPADPAGMRRLGRTLLLAMIAGGRGSPVALVGVGAGPLPGRAAPGLAHQLVRRADLLVLRDEKSAHALADAGAPTPFRIGADPAWTQLDDLPGEGAPPEDLVTVAVTATRPGTAVTDLLVDGLGEALAAGLRVRLLPWRAGLRGLGDLELAQRVAERLRGRAEVSPPPGGLRGARAAFAGARVAVVVPYHAVLAAASAGVPHVVVTAHEVARRRSRSVARSIVPVGAVPGRLGTAILTEADGPPTGPAAVRERIAAAEEGFRLLRLLLNEGRSDESDVAGSLDLAPVTWAR